jgi:isocitrate dehydrogenase
MVSMNLAPPEKGGRIRFENGEVITPDNPVIPYIIGEGSGPDIWAAASRVLDAAVRHAYKGSREISWFRVYAGDKAASIYGNEVFLPDETLEILREYMVAIKGPLSTPVGFGRRSLNVALRQRLDLYACVRPIRYFAGIPTPMKHPELIDVVIFRENTDDIYAGIEWKAGSPEATKVISWLRNEMGVQNIRFPDSTSIGIKPMSRECTERIVRAAINYAVDFERKSVTIVHKGNIMKYTEGGFRDWAYEIAAREFGAMMINGGHSCRLPNGILIKDAIADSFFEQALTMPQDLDVIVAPNLNGDYISSTFAAQAGGISMSPGGNINFDTGNAIFETTHGTVPHLAGLNKANPSAMILSGVMMFRYMKWYDAASLVLHAMSRTVARKIVTADLAHIMPGALEASCSEFADAIIADMPA